ncbi:hypothetical protein N7453_003232 [Penicillium expansum]|nr:hypothetical protein N7453_003232 [Penicillium expansum]
MALNLEKQLLFYGAYHSNPVHSSTSQSTSPASQSYCSPASSLPVTARPSSHSRTSSGSNTCPRTPEQSALFIYATFYILLEPIAGGLLAPAVITAAYYGNYFLSTYGSTVNYWAGGIHIVSWLAQFVGHGVFEKRAPALLDNLVQALLLAPLFVWMEVLFFFGYRSELKKRFEKGVELEILKFRKQGNENGKGKGKSEQ